ncbi:MAG: aminomethyl-transferring glycine dehydrogenase subunit GcvPB [Bdellovibrionota bacterium]|nr:aminomethyl-transferring glycine dehydrogenase subunit GcvPB [Bdellovibrionota bacterium]
MFSYEETEAKNQKSVTQNHLDKLPYNPLELPRELKTFYISATDQDVKEMFASIDVSNREQLFSHLPSDILMNEEEHVGNLGEALPYGDLVDHMEEVAAKNNIRPCFIGDGLKWGKVHPIVPFVCDIRGLTTAYTPYQPERSQGTLHTLWNYASGISMLTGFEAINASFYERSTALYEALNTALRIKRKTNKVIITEGLYPGDWEVLETLAKETTLELIKCPLDENGLTDEAKLTELIKDHGVESIAAVTISQINSLGKCENIHELTNIIHSHGLLTIGIIDPATLAGGGLTPPSQWGEKGADMIVGEGQNLGIGPNFGGPGLGIFGIRFNDQNKTAIRSTAGRFVGKAKDEDGKDCLVMVLSTREQHIRREKATSNICSNQSYLATIVGAALLAKGEEGLREANDIAHQRANQFAAFINEETSCEILYPQTPFFNEVAIKVPAKAKEVISLATQAGVHLGVDISERTQTDSILIYFNEAQSDADLDLLFSFFKKNFSDSTKSEEELATLPESFLRKTQVGLPKISIEELKKFYTTLGDMNVSPDDNIYPLGSCTMKYNPYINDWAANLTGFTDIHPQAPLEDAQGSLEVLYEIQEQFKAITGLPGVTTQPVAGAQGELVGIKMFQAYHRSKGNEAKKDIILIPASAHGTNPATATMAGYVTNTRAGQVSGIVTIGADSEGHINFDELKDLVALYNDRIAGIMITNPNTSGIFESKFREIADLIHSVDGLVYMDGANMNAIAGWLDLDRMGVDAVHNNLHKTWTIPHGGGGPGDAIVAVSEKLIDFLPGKQITKNSEGRYEVITPAKTMGSIHRHWGNFAHKVRAYTYIKALGAQGVKEMSAIAVLSSKYLYARLRDLFPTLPAGADQVPRMHEFILTISKETFEKIQAAGTPKAQAISKIGKLFLDFGLHAPTVSFPEPFGLMIEPTESFSKKELDEFVEVLVGIHRLLEENPEVLTTAPHFTPVRKVDEVGANKSLILSGAIKTLPDLPRNRIEPGQLKEMGTEKNLVEILKAHKERRA